MLDKISLSINKGEVVVVLGPLRGKSTLLRASYWKISRGEVPSRSGTWSEERCAATGIECFSKQDSIPNMTVLNVILAPSCAVRVLKFYSGEAAHENETKTAVPSCHGRRLIINTHQTE